MEQYLHYFCGDASNANALAETEPLRISFYKATATFMRAYADIAQNLTEAEYSNAEIAALTKETEFYSDTRAAIKKHSGEELDIKPFEADMRHLINTYIQADPADDLGNLNSLSLTELIIETGIHDAIARKLNEKGKLSKNAIAEGIINNVRKTIIRDQLTDPRFYEEMSKLLDDLIKQSRADTAAYEDFLKKAEDLVIQLAKKSPAGGIPAILHGKPEAIVLFNNLAIIQESRATSSRYTRATSSESAGVGALEIVPHQPGLGFDKLPMADADDLCFDFEGDPMYPGGLEYLCGVLWQASIGDTEGDPVPGHPNLRFRAFWAHVRAQEKQAFADLMAFLMGRLARSPAAHLYH